MEGAIMAPGNNGRLKSRVRNNNSGRSSISRLLASRSHINNKNNRNHSVAATVRSNSLRNNANQRHLHNFSKNLRGGNQTVVDNAAYVNNNGNNSETKIICAGNFTREVYNAICPLLGHPLHIPEDSVQALFNDMHLYPSKSQVSEMLQCARQCGRRNGASNYITFGEFCVFVREMQNQLPKQHRKIQQCKPNNKCVDNCEVFLGGSCNPTTWRADTAIPELQKHGISFYNPQVAMWAPELVAQEHDAKQAASVLLFVIDSQTRSTVGMIEVAYLVSSGRCVVVVAQPYRPGQSIMGEKITHREYRDLVEGQTTLLMLVTSKGIKVHSNLPSALQSTANILRNSSNNGLTTEEQLTSKLRKLREVFDSYGGQNGEINVYKFLGAFQELTQRELKINELYEYIGSSSNENVANMSISFERFCMLMAEFTTDRCDTCTTDVWATQPFQRQCSTNNNSCTIDNSHVIEELPMNKPKPSYDVFLGGTRDSHITWRRDIAIPTLKKHGITYYNPAVRETNGYEVIDNNMCMFENNINNKNVTDQDVLEWKQAMDRSKVLLFVITNDTRSLTTMVFAAHYIGLGKSVVLSIQQLSEEDCVICSESLSKQAIKDYNRGRVYLADMAKRKQIPVFENITEAVQCVVDKCQSR